jgi:formylglycine-generating enzyme required for sulfatase activity
MTLRVPALCDIPAGVAVAAFRLGRTQVTNAEYDVFVAATAREAARFRGDDAFASPAQPVVGVSWFDAAAYCAWLAEETGTPFRLPTEAEWEHAARGGHEGALYPWGDTPPRERYPDYAALWLRGPEPVGMHSNAYGLFEMCENVHEWCADWHDPEAKTRRASRGGAWRHQLKVSTCAARSSIPPEYRYADYGFRVAADAR